MSESRLRLVARKEGLNGELTLNDGDEKTKGIPAQATSSVSSQRATLASDSLTTYLNDIRKPKLLTVEEECHCARQALLGDETGRRKLIESNLRLVVNI